VFPLVKKKCASGNYWGKSPKPDAHNGSLPRVLAASRSSFGARRRSRRLLGSPRVNLAEAAEAAERQCAIW